MRPQKGNSITVNTSVTRPFLNKPCGLFAEVWLDVLTFKVRLVTPEPAEMESGEKLAVAPAGSPLTVSAMDAGIVVPPTGLIVSGKVACPPAAVVTVPLPVDAMEKSWTSVVTAELVPDKKFVSPE